MELQAALQARAGELQAARAECGRLREALGAAVEAAATRTANEVDRATEALLAQNGEARRFAEAEAAATLEATHEHGAAAVAAAEVRVAAADEAFARLVARAEAAEAAAAAANQAVARAEAVAAATTAMAATSSLAAAPDVPAVTAEWTPSIWTGGAHAVVDYGSPPRRGSTR